MDMVTMTIIDSTMVSICREMGISLMKTSYSTIFNEGLDFTCALADAEGEMIAVAEFNPAQIGGMPLVVQSSVRELSTEPLEPGDVIVHNDPYRGGLHTPEHSFFTPIFVDGELMGYAVAIGHVAEVGGSVPGGFPSEATEIFHEGLRVPPIKIKRAGKDNDDVWKLLLANVRTPAAQLRRLPRADRLRRDGGAAHRGADPEVRQGGVQEHLPRPDGLFGSAHARRAEGLSRRALCLRRLHGG